MSGTLSKPPYPKAFPLLLLLVFQAISVSCVSAQVHLTVRNESGLKVTLNWVNPKDSSRTTISNLEDGDDTRLNTYKDHVFEIQEVPRPTTGVCQSEDQTCKVAFFKVGEELTQEIVFTSDYEAVEADGMAANMELLTPPSVVLSACRDAAREGLATIASPEEETIIVTNYESCLKKGLAPQLKRANDEIEFQKVLRTEAAYAMENFTCSDPDSVSSPDISHHEWVSQKDGVSRMVHVKFERPASRIHVVENFTSPEECAAMEESARLRLHKASTADGRGGNQLNPSRKAMQAGINPNWSLTEDEDPIVRLSSRVYDYANYVLDLNITWHGQEPLMSIQYSGRGHNDTEPDRYKPHCDGKCEGRPLLHAARIATMVIYCTIPERGGHTNFQKANVHVKPEVGNAIFFSYVDPVTNITDTGFTEHSGCPVYEGEKKIVTQWIRYGVTKEKGHTKYNTLGIDLSEAMG